MRWRPRAICWAAGLTSYDQVAGLHETNMAPHVHPHCEASESVVVVGSTSRKNVTTCRDDEASAPGRREHPDRRRTSRVRIVHLASHEVVNLGAMVLVVGQALVHVRTLQVREAAADLIHAGAVDDQADDVVDADPGAFDARVPASDAR